MPTKSDTEQVPTSHARPAAAVDPIESGLAASLSQGSVVHEPEDRAETAPNGKPPTHPISVFIVDKQEMVAEAMLRALASVPGMEPVGRAGTKAEAVVTLASLSRSMPDVVLIDHRLPDGSGLDLAARVVAAYPSTGVVLVTAEPDAAALAAALDAGCRGYLTKNARFESLISTIERVARGEVAISASMLQDLGRHLEPRRSRPADTLTDREREVLRMLARGASTSEIVSALSLSAHTVRTHVRNILHKLNAHSRLQAVSTARQLDLIVD